MHKPILKRHSSSVSIGTARPRYWPGRARRQGSGNPGESELVIGKRAGEPWADYDWDNWRERTFRPDAAAAGLPADADDGASRVRPRDLGSSFATLLIYEGRPPQYVASQLGPATLLRDYARLWEDFDPSQRISAEEPIARASQTRARLGPLLSEPLRAARERPMWAR